MRDREPRLERTRDGEDLIDLGLGALGWLDRFARAVAPRADAPGPPDEALLAAALGLLSLRRSLRRWGGQAAAAVVAAPPPRAPQSPESLMR